jgi:hypothetical protein
LNSRGSYGTKLGAYMIKVRRSNLPRPSEFRPRTFGPRTSGRAGSRPPITEASCGQRRTPQLHGGLLPFWQITVVPEFGGTTTVAGGGGGEGLLLLIQADSSGSTTNETSRSFIVRSSETRTATLSCLSRASTSVAATANFCRPLKRGPCRFYPTRASSARFRTRSLLFFPPRLLPCAAREASLRSEGWKRSSLVNCLCCRHRRCRVRQRALRPRIYIDEYS